MYEWRRNAQVQRVVLLLTFMMVGVLLASPAVWAKRVLKKPKKAPLAVVVLPFSGRQAGGAASKDALELELELLEQVDLVPSASIEKQLKTLKPQANTLLPAPALAVVLKRVNVDVLVTGTRLDGELIRVVAYARDGRPRLVRDVALPSTPADTAAAVAPKLVAAMKAWPTQKPITPPTRPVPVDVDRLVVDEGDASSTDATSKGIVVRRGSQDDEGERDAEPPKPPVQKEAEDVDDIVDEDLLTGAPAAPSKSKKKAKPADTRAVPDDAETDDQREPAPAPARAKKSSKPRRSIDDEEPLQDEQNASRRPRERIADIEANAPEQKRATHIVAVSAGFQGATWQYAFSGQVGDTDASSAVSSSFYPGGMLRLDVWPIPWVGVDVDVALGAIRFALDAKSEIRPREFTAYHLAGGAFVKGRYVFNGGVRGLGIGARLGYRFWGSSVETQTIADGSARTIVPGFQFHAVAVGLETTVPLIFFQRRFELDVRAEALPLSFYSEVPDNPGQTSLGYGAFAAAAVRYEVLFGVYVEAGAFARGVSVEYKGKAEKGRIVTLPKGEFTLEGGNVINWTAGGTLGLGYFF